MLSVEFGVEAALLPCDTSHLPGIPYTGAVGVHALLKYSTDASRPQRLAATGDSGGAMRALSVVVGPARPARVAQHFAALQLWRTGRRVCAPQRLSLLPAAIMEEPQLSSASAASSFDEAPPTIASNVLSNVQFAEFPLSAGSKRWETRACVRPPSPNDPVAE